MYYYSPGVCPEGYATATTFTSSWGRLDTILAIGSDTTVALCCPSKFSYASDGHACVSTFASITSKLTYINPQLDANNQWTSTSASPPLITTASGDPYHIYGDGIPIMWQESDLKAFAEAATATSSTSTTISTSLSAGLPAQTATTNTTTTLPKTTSAPTLSTGAKIAIGLVVPAVVIAVVAVVAIWFIRKRKRGINAGLGSGVDGEQGSSSQMMMMREQGKFDPDRKGVLEERLRSELGADQPAGELYGERGMGDKKETRHGEPMELAA
ncbi:transmembrane alpha-helix domain-containing protein [Rutstroemia sp. NJR-2017a BVV2]|nr:transmembrane alpha-helix domain-containing protein [Rutstroemia sp. NJR-2017a BVV2]